jgi:hypothetical protein
MVGKYGAGEVWCRGRWGNAIYTCGKRVCMCKCALYTYMHVGPKRYGVGAEGDVVYTYVTDTHKHTREVCCRGAGGDSFPGHAYTYIPSGASW